MGSIINLLSSMLNRPVHALMSITGLRWWPHTASGSDSIASSTKGIPFVPDLCRRHQTRVVLRVRTLPAVLALRRILGHGRRRARELGGLCRPHDGDVRHSRDELHRRAAAIGPGPRLAAGCDDDGPDAAHLSGAVAETMAVLPRQPSTAARQVLIVGAGEAGAMVAREMQKNPNWVSRPSGSRRRAGQGASAAFTDFRYSGPSRPCLRGPIATRGCSDHRDPDCRRSHGPLRGGALPGVGDSVAGDAWFLELLDGQVSVSRLRSLDIT